MPKVLDLERGLLKMRNSGLKIDFFNKTSTSKQQGEKSAGDKSEGDATEEEGAIKNF